MLPRSADDIRAFNPNVNILSFPYTDFQTPNDSTLFVIPEPHPVRPASEDDCTFDLTGTTGTVTGSFETSRAPEADGVAVEDDVHLCDSCLSALGYLAHYMKKPPGTNEKDEERLINDKPAVVHHGNLIALNIAAAIKGCHLCNTLFSRYFDPMFGHLGADRLTNTRLELTLNTTELKSWNGEHPGDPRLLCIATLTNMERTTANYYTYFRLQLWPSPQFDHYFENREHQPGPFPKQLKFPPEYASTTGTQSLAKQWFENCRRNIDGSHDSCNFEGSEWLPSRLLDLSTYQKDRKIRVVTSTSNRTVAGHSDHTYITLSHCWGEWGAKELPVLKKANIDERQQEGIDFEKLPKTFQDAVVIAGWFNVQWLWIDSLCIIQDSEADWEHEALLMCEVYKNALLNISADGSLDARGGCFQGRHPASVTPFKLHLRTMGSAWWVTPDERNLFKWMTHSMSSRRAWIFQERNLSKRILHFTREEVVWECCAPAPSFACETYPTGSPLKRAFLGQTKIEIPPKTAANNMQDQPLLRQRWYETCSDFSKRHLTYPTDRLPALAGLAKEFATRCPSDQYLAGLWSSTLPFSLFWAIDSRALPNHPPTSPKTYAPQYVAPSWSWMSTPLPTMFRELGDCHSLISIQDPTDLKKHGDRFGKVKNASIMVEGILRQIQVTTEQSFDESEYPLPIGHGKWHKLFVDGESQIIGHLSDWSRDFSIRIDREDTIEAGQYYCLFLITAQDSPTDERALKGLLLEWSNSAGGFRRVGIASFQGTCALNMRYRFKGEDKTGDRTAWDELWDAVVENWGESRFAHPTKAAKQMQLDGDGPLSLYHYDENADTSAFERLTASWIKLV